MHRGKTILSNKISLPIIAVFIIGALMAVFVYGHTSPLHKNSPSSANDQDQEILDFHKQYQQQKINVNATHTVNASSPLLGKSGLVPVLMYHHVGSLAPNTNSTERDLTVSAADFSSQMTYLSTQGYHTINLDQLYAALTAHASLPTKPLVITFDDGYSDVFENAVPILKENKMVGIFGIITGFVDQPSYASWAQITQAQNSGMEIISHSYSHIDVHSLKYRNTDLETQVIQAQLDLKNHLGLQNKYYIYPYGHHTPYLEQVLKNQGILLSFTVRYGISDKGMNLLELPRVRVHGQETIEHFAQYLDPTLLRNVLDTRSSKQSAVSG